MGNVSSDIKSTNTKEEVLGNSETLVCAKCHNTLPKDAKFCILCGARVEDDDIIECPYCKSRIPKGKFCMSCGKLLEEVCPNCGETRNEGAKFCMSCGTKFE